MVTPNFTLQIQEAIRKSRAISLSGKRQRAISRNRQKSTTKLIMHIPIETAKTRAKSIKVVIENTWNKFIETGR